jgi:hypothetical protein
MAFVSSGWASICLVYQAKKEKGDRWSLFGEEEAVKERRWTPCENDWATARGGVKERRSPRDRIISMELNTTQLHLYLFYQRQ